LARTTLADVRLVAARDETDATRFRELGAPRVEVMGNLKFDQQMPDDLFERAAALRAQLGTRPVWIAASTHDGEEEQVLDTFARVREHKSDALLMLVPRHPERFSQVASLAERRGFRVVRRTENRACTADADIFLGDTMGELPLFYSCADVAFVGGSLVARGGHNMLEPAALGVPVVLGPHQFNFAEVSAALIAAGGARQVQDAQQLGQVVGELLADAAARKRMGEAGQRLVAENRGALQRLLDLIAPLIVG
jgi:3-deoxy-D-manno-octulosonic-acid transferase